MIATSVRQLPELGPHSNGMLMTPDEFDAATEWEPGYRYELIHGVLVVNPPAGLSERDPNDELGYLIRRYREDHPNGLCVDLTAPEQTVRVGENRRRADRAIWIGLGRRPDDELDTPTIAVEFPANRARDRLRDYVVKRKEYADAGVEEYWIIDTHRREMTVHRRNGETLVVSAGETYRTPLMPGFELALARLM
ncbi:MAG: Uma2 family endonuclease [Planctomycetaceae bacterium]|nr:Uma2 family endonuclease [Planctomycetaceae bacterium]